VRAAGVTTFANKVHGLPAKRALEELNAKMLTEGFIAANFHPTFVEALRSANFASELNCPAPFGPFTLTSSEESILADLSVSEFTDLSSTDTNALSEPRRAQFARAQALLKKAKIVVAPSLTDLGETTKLLEACATAYFGSVSNVAKWAREWHEFTTTEPSKMALQRLQVQYENFENLPMLLQVAMDRQIATFGQESLQGPSDGSPLATSQLFRSILDGTINVNIPNFVRTSLRDRAAVRAERDRIDRDHRTAQQEYQQPAFQFQQPPRPPPRRWDNPPPQQHRPTFPPPPPPGLSPYQPTPRVHPDLHCSDEMYRHVISPCLVAGRVRSPLFNGTPECLGRLLTGRCRRNPCPAVLNNPQAHDDPTPGSDRFTAIADCRRAMLNDYNQQRQDGQPDFR